MRIFHCPDCGAPMTEQCQGPRPWICPKCSGKFQASQAYVNSALWVTLAISMIFFYVLRLRVGSYLLLAG